MLGDCLLVLRMVRLPNDEHSAHTAQHNSFRSTPFTDGYNGGCRSFRPLEIRPKSFRPLKNSPQVVSPPTDCKLNRIRKKKQRKTSQRQSYHKLVLVLNLLKCFHGSRKNVYIQVHPVISEVTWTLHVISRSSHSMEVKLVEVSLRPLT